MTRESFRALQKQLFRALRDRPLDLTQDEDLRLYQPLYDERHDPVTRLFDTIEFSESQSVQLVAGFRGTGKTTEFSRLEKLLWRVGFMVIRVDLDNYMDMHSPADIVNFVLLLQGAISDRLTDERLLGPNEGLRKSFWERAKNFLTQEVEIDGPKVPYVDLKVNLRGDQTLRERLRQTLAGKLPRLIEEVHAHHLDVLAALRARSGAPPRLVVIVDSLEHLRGPREQAQDVRHSIEELFFSHGKHLSLPDTHLVMSVPAFLALRANNLAAEFVNGAVQAWPACRVRDRSGRPVPASIDRMVTLIEKRGDWRHLLPDRSSLDELILASGGYLRDLLNMLIEGIHLAEGGVASDQARRIIAIARRAYQPIYADEVEVLRRIAQGRSLGAVNLAEQEYVLGFLDSHLLLCYLNDQFWYDVHPLVRDEVVTSESEGSNQ